MEMCLTSTNFTLKKKFTAVHLVKGFFLWIFFFVDFFPACFLFCFVFDVQASRKLGAGLSCLYLFGVPGRGVVPGLCGRERGSPAGGGRSGAAGRDQGRRGAQRGGRRVPV